MTSAIGFLVVGLLMLAMGLLAPAMRRLPLTTAIIYLAVGMVVGPTVLGLFHFNPLKQSAALEVLTEAAVLISLFAAGVKLPAPVSWARWRSPVLLAFVSMAVTVFLVAAYGYYLLALPLGAAVLSVRSSRPPTRCSQATSRCATRATATGCASTSPARPA